MKCTIDGCDGEAKTRNFCSKHYLRLMRTGTTDPQNKKKGRPKSIGICSSDGCLKSLFAKGKCQFHYMESRYSLNKNHCSRRDVETAQNEHNKKVQKAMRQNITIPTVFRGLNTAKK